MSGFDLKNEDVPVPEHFKGLAQGRMVRYVINNEGLTRPAVVVGVADQASGLVELQVFWGQHAPVHEVIDEQTGLAGIVRYDASGKTMGSWHWPPRAG